MVRNTPLMTTTELSGGFPGEAKSVRALGPGPTPKRPSNDPDRPSPGLCVSPSSDGVWGGHHSTWV